MKVLIDTKELSHDEWLKYRQMGLGGSDIGAIAGMNPWKSPISVFLDKTGQGEPIPDSERMRIGRDLEDYVAQRFAEAQGVKVRKRNAILQHDDYPFMLANIDREIVGKKEGLECKVTNSFGRTDWENEIPPYYELQCHHYMAVTGYDAWWLAALIGNEKVIIKKIKRDPEIIDYLIQLEQRFWEDHVLKNEMPAPDGSADATEIIKKKYPKDNGETLEIYEQEWQDRAKRYCDLNALIKDLQREQDTIKQEIQLELKEAQKAVIGDYRVKWSTVISNRLDSKSLEKEHPEIVQKYKKESSSRRFEIRGGTIND